MPDDNDKEYERLLSAYYSVFRDSDAGRIVLDDLESRFYRRTFISSPVDPNSILCNEGARSAVIYILSKIEEFEQEHGRRR